MPRVLYLDMNVWVDMARGCLNAVPAWMRIRDRLLRAVDAGQLVVPLSPAHYLELWHRRDTPSRERVARLMRDVTGYASIPSAYVVRTREAQVLVRGWAGGESARLTSSDLVGRGAAHAFGRPEGRFRFVESTASRDGSVPEGSPVEPPPGWSELQAHPEWEWFQLAGIDALFDVEWGLDRTPEHRYGSVELKRELTVREWLRAHPLQSADLKDLILAEEFASLREYVEDACIEARVPPPVHLRSGNWGPLSAKAMRDLVDAVPSANAWSTLRFLKHRDSNLPWEQHDWTDLWALSVAIPYCDVVVTERRWAHLAATGGLSRRYGTTVSSGWRAIENELGRVDDG